MATSATTNGLSKCVILLLENERDVFVGGANLLIKIAKNILDNPGDETFRKMRVAGKALSTRLLPIDGGFQCLFEMGFEEADEFLILPVKSSLTKLRVILAELQQELNKPLNHGGEPASSAPAIGSSVLPTSLGTSAAQTTGTGVTLLHQNIMKSEADFYRKVLSSFEHVLLYEAPAAQQRALSHIPLKRLKINVAKNMEALKSPGDVDYRDLLLLELLAWFKKEFFSWTNAPKCRQCGGGTQSTGMTEATAEELLFGAHRVENYRCDTCNVFSRFPRYNDPVRLLESRTGRCGEWANCFTLCCRAVGFEARYVLDWTDHVWTEVYSEKQERWLHCDPCENSCDKPLVYETGWNKTLSYIMAFSKDDIQDVTWRYSNKHQEVCKRRTLCRESWLLNLILKLRIQRQQVLPTNIQSELKNRLLVELIEFLSTKSIKDDEKTGRISGSMAWRAARGEIKIGNEPTASKSKCTIKPTDQDLKSHLICLEYCCASDVYTRGDGSQTDGWQNMVYEVENVFRKEESDWNMVYLARTEGSDTASISWKFDMLGSGVVVDRMEILARSKCYENGRISWRVCSDDQCAVLSSDGRNRSIDDLSGCSAFTLTATMSGGLGNVAWQHTQLFRQDYKDDMSPLQIKIYLKSA